jgi:hypothetical protein
MHPSYGVRAGRPWRPTISFALALMRAPDLAAQTTDAAVEAPRARADASFRRATEAYQRGDYVEAARLFRVAYALVPHPHALYNLARALESGGDVVGALESWQRFGAEAPTDAERAEAAAHTASLRAREVEVFVATDPLDATVTLDAAAAPAGRTPLRLRVTPGGHVLVLRREGHRDRVQRIEVAPGVAQDLRLALEPLPAPAVPAPAPPTNDARILSRRTRGLLGWFSARASATFGIAWPRETVRFANGIDLTLFVRRIVALQFHALRVEDAGVPTTILGELGWVYVADDIDVGFFLHAGALLDCSQSCREGTSDRELLVGGTVRADVLLHPHIGVGLFARFSWRDADLTRSEALLSSLGFSVSLFL